MPFPTSYLQLALAHALNSGVKKWRGKKRFFPRTELNQRGPGAYLQAAGNFLSLNANRGHCDHGEEIEFGRIFSGILEGKRIF